MSRLSIRPRPLDIHKKLPIVRSIKDFDDDDTFTLAATTRNAHLLRYTCEADEEVYQESSKKSLTEIATPQFSIVDTYERDYLSTFVHPTSYLRGRAARSEIGEFVEYDLDNEDENWLRKFNDDKGTLSPEMFESVLFKLEVLDHMTRERAAGQPIFGSTVPILLELDVAAEALQEPSLRLAVLHSVYNYWKAKRKRWQKPILRRLQPPPPASDKNPYNSFRLREKVHRLYTRRVQKRENSVNYFEKLQLVRHNLEHAQLLVEALIKREEKKRKVMKNDIDFQRFHVEHKNEAQLMEVPLNSIKYARSNLIEPVQIKHGSPWSHSFQVQNLPVTDSNLMVASPGHLKREWAQRSLPHILLKKKGLEAVEPVLLFTRTLEPDKLLAAGIRQPPDLPTENGSTVSPYRFHGRIGRGGRIIFDRWNPFSSLPLGI